MSIFLLIVLLRIWIVNIFYKLKKIEKWKHLGNNYYLLLWIHFTGPFNVMNMNGFYCTLVRDVSKNSSMRRIGYFPATLRYFHTYNVRWRNPDDKQYLQQCVRASAMRSATVGVSKRRRRDERLTGVLSRRTGRGSICPYKGFVGTGTRAGDTSLAVDGNDGVIEAPIVL